MGSGGAQAQFDALHYWNHDDAPSAEDWLPRVMEWATDCSLVHDAVTDEEYAAAEAKFKGKAP